MTKIILLGSSGFIGTPLLEKLLKENYSVKTLLHNTKSDQKTDFFKGDINEPDILNDIIEDGDTIVNLIGQINDMPKFIDDNIIGGINILNSCIKKKKIRIILASSISVYGENIECASKENDVLNPQSKYGIVKSITEKIYEYYSKTFGLDITVLRFATLYGPNKNSGFIVKLIKSLKDNKVNVVFNNGQQIRDLLFVSDAVNSIICAIKKPQKDYSIFNISSGNQFSVNQIINVIEKLANKKLLIKQSSEIPDERCLSADNTKAYNILDFSPKIDINTGMKITLESFLTEE